MKGKREEQREGQREGQREKKIYIPTVVYIYIERERDAVATHTWQPPYRACKYVSRHG